MAPTRQKKSKTAEAGNSVDVATVQSRNKELWDKPLSPTGRSPIRKGPMRITSRQKQALIDNLQLEITERARKLRAQYAMQAQGLRTRIEIRVNRIPIALRKANMGGLFTKSNEATGKPKSSTDSPSSQIRTKLVSSPPKFLLQENQNIIKQSPSTMRAKRPSDEITDKENENLANPKKRLKAPVPPERTTSRAKLQPNQVLSPRSANSRTLPRSPVRPEATTGNPQLTRPISPLKPAGPVPVTSAAGILTNMVGRAKSTRSTAARKVKSSSSDSTMGAGRGKRAPRAAATLKAGKKRASNGSESSEASSGTAIIIKATAPKKAPVKKTAVGTVRGIGNNSTKKPETVTVATTKRATATRILRKRN